MDFVVTSTGDATDAHPGDGVCGSVASTSGPDTVCTLRAAIQEANATGGMHTIALQQKTYVLSIQGDDDSAGAGDLDISNGDLVLRGSDSDLGSVIKANGALGDRVLDLRPGAGSVALLDVRLTGGKSPAGSAGGCIRSQNGELLLFQSQADHCTAATSGGGLYISRPPSGDAINVLVERSSVAFNSAADVGGGIAVDLPITMINSTVANNIAGNRGGGLLQFEDRASIFFSTIGGNRVGSSGTTPAPDAGGGLYLDLAASAVLRGTVLANNYVLGTTPVASDCSATGAFELYGFNHLTSTTGCIYVEGRTPNNLNMPAQISVLQNADAASYAMFPQPGSHLLDFIPMTSCDTPDALRIVGDQRRGARPANATCDIGAIEGVSDVIFLDGVDW